MRSQRPSAGVTSQTCPALLEPFLSLLALSPDGSVFAMRGGHISGTQRQEPARKMSPQAPPGSLPWEPGVTTAVRGCQGVCARPASGVRAVPWPLAPPRATPPTARPLFCREDPPGCCKGCESPRVIEDSVLEEARGRGGALRGKWGGSAPGRGAWRPQAMSSLTSQETARCRCRGPSHRGRLSAGGHSSGIVSLLRCLGCCFGFHLVGLGLVETTEMYGLLVLEAASSRSRSWQVSSSEAREGL